MQNSMENKLTESFQKQSIMATFGASMTYVEAGKVIISAPISDHVLQQHGFAHAALTFALGDSAAGYAALSVLPLDAEVLTAEMKINLLAPAAGERVEATGHVIKRGKRLVVVGANVVAVEGNNRRDIAVLQGTMVPVEPT